ncbi:BRCT domain-containing protein [Shewanella sp. M-Br]|uniref:BRCT domain-containing protein n=1 Tax=Shewanella sp. M-Br TaxID=2495595 RepID=UPI0029494159|nr:hypothetical protein SMBr_15210 [Shewanella sp. M-Br]
MTVFELLGIKQGDAILVDNPWSDYGERQVIPIALSKNGISIRAIDCRYGDICYVSAEWRIRLSGDSMSLLGDIPYIKQKLLEWKSREELERTALEKVKIEEIEREFASIDEVINILNVDNLKVVITGELSIPRAEMKSLLESKGAVVMGAVSRNTAYLFMGNTGEYGITGKMQKAHELGVKIITL